MKQRQGGLPVTHTYRFPDGEVVTWTGQNRCLCTDCRLRFNSVGAFDKHLKRGQHLHPAALGMSQNEDEGNLFVVDWHHQTLEQEEGERDDAPAAFWIKDIIVDDGYVYGVVDSWTPKAEAAVRSKEYRYLSAVFAYQEDNGRIVAYHSFGLLNRSGTHYQRVIGLAKGATMKQVNLTLTALSALALGDSVSEDEVTNEILSLKKFEKELLGLTGVGDRESAYGSVTALKAKAEKANALQAQLDAHKAEAEKSEREGLIATALKANKLSPAQAKEDGFARTVPLATLKAFLKDAPTIIAGEVREPGVATPKAWEDMTGVEKAALYQDNPELYKGLRKTALGY